jgi:hypothetical protein
MEDNQQVNARLIREGGGRAAAFYAIKQKIREELVAQGVPGKKATAIAHERTLQEFPPLSATSVVSAGPSNAERIILESREKLEAREREQGIQQEAKDRLCETAGDKDDLQTCVKWAMSWQPRVLVEGRIRWDRITEAAPSVAAIGILEQACLNPTVFYGQTVKNTLGKTSGLGEDQVKREKKRIEELHRRLDEVDAYMGAKS